MSGKAQINIKFFANLKDFSTKMQTATRQIKKMGRSFTKVGKGLSLGVTLPILAIGAAAIKSASDGEETASKFNVVFSSISKSAQESAKVLRNSYGLSTDASKQLLSDTGDLLTGFGFSQQAALDLSTEVNKLAVDLASFTNFSGGAEGASQALTKALLGERESVKSLGISILEADVKARVLLNTQKGLTFESERQAKAYATLQLAQEQSKNAIGDFARTSGSFANQLRILQARLADLSSEIGTILLPYALRLVNHLKGLVESFSNLSPVVKKTIVVFGAMAAVIGPLLVSLGFMMTTVVPGLSIAFGYLAKTVLPAVATRFSQLNAVMIANPIGIAIAAVAALAYGFTALVQQITPAVSKFQTFWNFIKSGGDGIRFMNLQMADQVAGMLADEKATEAAAKAAAKLASDQYFAAEAARSLTAELLKKNRVVNPAGKQINTNVVDIQTTSKGIDEGFLNIPEKLAGVVNEIVPYIQKAINVFNDFDVAVGEIMTNVAQSVAVGFGEVLGGIAAGTASAADIIGVALTAVADILIQLGRLAIQTAISIQAIKTALKTLNPVVAVAAGIAAIALGTFVKSQANKIGGGGSRRAFANGGIVYGPTNALIGEYAGASSNPEVVAPLDKLKDLIGNTGGSQYIPYILESKLVGADIKLLLKRQDAIDGRTS